MAASAVCECQLADPMGLRGDDRGSEDDGGGASRVAGMLKACVVSRGGERAIRDNGCSRRFHVGCWLKPRPFFYLSDGRFDRAIISCTSLLGMMCEQHPVSFRTRPWAIRLLSRRLGSRSAPNLTLRAELRRREALLGARFCGGKDNHPFRPELHRHAELVRPALRFTSGAMHGPSFIRVIPLDCQQPVVRLTLSSGDPLCPRVSLDQHREKSMAAHALKSRSRSRMDTR